MSLAVMWSENDAPAQPGRLDLSTSRLQLAGGSPSGARGLELDLADVARAGIGRKTADRVGGRMTLVLELRDGGRLRIAAVEQLGAMRELAERIQRSIPED
jgi:hypothetical protein